MLQLAHLCVAKSVPLLVLPPLGTIFPKKYFVLCASWGGAVNTRSRRHGLVFFAGVEEISNVHVVIPYLCVDVRKVLRLFRRT